MLLLRNVPPKRSSLNPVLIHPVLIQILNLLILVANIKKSKKKRRTSKKKSGVANKASDKVKIPQIWPHSKLQYEFVSENVPFKKLDFNMFVAGELEILTAKIS